MKERINWHEYFMKVAIDASKRSTCLRRQIGAVIVKDNCLISTGYNGSPSNTRHCTDMQSCIRDEMSIQSGTMHELCRSTHAEQNAVALAAKSGVSTNNSVMYCTTYPCIICTKIIINAGIKTIYYINAYPDIMSEGMLGEAGVKTIKIFMGDDINE
jgi:dCMP deaminase